MGWLLEALVVFVPCSCYIVLRRVLTKFQYRLGVIPVEAKTRQLSIAVSRTQAEAKSVRSRSSSHMRLDAANIVCLWGSGHGSWAKRGDAEGPPFASAQIRTAKTNLLQAGTV